LNKLSTHSLTQSLLNRHSVFIKMDERLVLLVCLAIVQLFHSALSCPPSCSWTTCRHQWRNDWSPSNPPQGRCIEQGRRAHHIYSRHNGKGRCPASQNCSPASQRRRLCKLQYRCRVTVKPKQNTIIALSRHEHCTDIARTLHGHCMVISHVDTTLFIHRHMVFF